MNKDIGLPNGLTFDPFSKLLCWADAGTATHGMQIQNTTMFSKREHSNRFYSKTKSHRLGLLAYIYKSTANDLPLLDDSCDELPEVLDVCV